MAHAGAFHMRSRGFAIQLPRRHRPISDTLCEAGTMRKLVGGKLHCIRVTDANLDYHGSIILDPDHCEQAGILSHGVRGSLGCVD